MINDVFRFLLFQFWSWIGDGDWAYELLAFALQLESKGLNEVEMR